VKSFDATKPRRSAVESVQVPRRRVVATNYWSAKQGRDALQIEWTKGRRVARHGEDARQLRAQASSGASRQESDADAALASATKRLEAEYDVPIWPCSDGAAQLHGAIGGQPLRDLDAPVPDVRAGVARRSRRPAGARLDPDAILGVGSAASEPAR